MEDKQKIKIEKDGLGVSIKALIDGMEGLVSTKTVVGEPIELQGALIVPLIEVTAGLAAGSLARSDSAAGAMSAKISPVALLIVQEGRTRLVSVRNTDVFTRLLDLIPEAVDRVKKGAVSEEILREAQAMASADEIEIIEGE